VFPRTVLLVASLAGCAAPCSPRPSTEASAPARARLLDVPFFADDTDQCGPSALASVLAFWGAPVDAKALKKGVYLTSLRGSLPLDLLLEAERRGFKARLYGGGLDDLKAELDKGHPLIAFINQGLEAAPLGHYVVVTGYDEGRRGLVVHSGPAKDKFVPYRKFSRVWDKTRRSTLLVLPPERDKESAHAAP
jgi:hypothetical protein